MAISNPSAIDDNILISSREFFFHRVRERFEARWAETLLSDENQSLNGFQCDRFLATLADALDRTAAPFSRVAVLAENRAYSALAVIGLLALQRIPVLVDPALGGAPPPDLAAVLGAQEDFSGDFAVPQLRIRPDGSIDEIPVDSPRKVALCPAETGLILRTSGSTGEPKWVRLPWRGLFGIVDTLIDYFPLDTHSAALVNLPLHHTMALNTQFLPTFLAGGTCRFRSSRFGLGRLYRDMTESPENFLSLVSSLLPVLISEQNRRQVPIPYHILDIQLAGENISSDHLRMARELFPSARIHKAYGLTEGIRVAMIASDDPQFSSPTVGFPLPGQEIQIRDHRGRRLPSPKTGEIYLRSPALFLGYDGQPAFDSADGFFSTGDHGSLTEEGRLVVTGRKDSTFKRRGKRVVGSEIERAAMDETGIEAAKCVPVPCERDGHRPILFLEMPEAEKDLEIRGAVIERALRNRLENFKVPREVFLLRSLPRLNGGKISLRRLHQLWQERDKLPVLGIGPFGCTFFGESP